MQSVIAKTLVKEPRFYVDLYTNGFDYGRLYLQTAEIGTNHTFRIEQDAAVPLARAYLDGVAVKTIYFTFFADVCSYEVKTESTCPYNVVDGKWFNLFWRNYYGSWEVWDEVHKVNENPYWILVYRENNWLLLQGGFLRKDQPPPRGGNSNTPHLKR